MEGHISNKYIKFITFRPHFIQKMCLKNFTKLLPIKANKIRLTEEIYYKFRNWVTYGNNIKL